MTSSSNVPAGMYPDPENPGQSRFWNGSSWEAPGAPVVPPATDVAQVTKKQAWKRKWFLITAGIFAVLVLGAIGSAGLTLVRAAQSADAEKNAQEAKPFARAACNSAGKPGAYDIGSAIDQAYFWGRLQEEAVKAESRDKRWKELRESLDGLIESTVATAFKGTYGGDGAAREAYLAKYEAACAIANAP